jgi:hypothetical protein
VASDDSSASSVDSNNPKKVFRLLFYKIFRWRIDFNLIWNKKKYLCLNPQQQQQQQRTTLRPVGFAAGKNSLSVLAVPGEAGPDVPDPLGYSLLCLSACAAIWFYVGKASPAVNPGIAAEFSLGKFAKKLWARISGYDDSHQLLSIKHRKEGFK